MNFLTRLAFGALVLVALQGVQDPAAGTAMATPARRELRDRLIREDRARQAKYEKAEQDFYTNRRRL